MPTRRTDSFASVRTRRGLRRMPHFATTLAACLLVCATTTARAQAPAKTTTGAKTPTQIDWRVLGGLDYVQGAKSDSLKKLEGTVVRIPGFVVPLDDFQEQGSEFLLVPYYGACIHTPPPPPNQIVYVKMSASKNVSLTLFEAVWMEGKLTIHNVDSPYGDVGFELEGLTIKPYAAK